MTRRSQTVLILAAASFGALRTTGVMGQLIPRPAWPKPAAIAKPLVDSPLTVKFVDQLKVRAVAGNLTSQVGGDLRNVQAVQTQFGLTFEQLIQLPQATLDFIESGAGLSLYAPSDPDTPQRPQTLRQCDSNLTPCFSLNVLPMSPNARYLCPWSVHLRDGGPDFGFPIL